MTGRVPPHDLAAEEALLGAMLMSRAAVAAGLEGCAAVDFYKPAHGHIFAAVEALAQRGEPADAVTVAGELARMDLLEAAGGQAVLIGLQSPATSSAARYARTVADLALLRRLVAVAGEISELGYRAGSDADDIIDSAASLLYPLADRRRATQAVPVAELVPEWLEALDARQQGGVPAGLATGWADLDGHLQGLRPGQLVTRCGRPAMGKSAVGLGLAFNVARAGSATLVVSAEMSRQELLDRLMARAAQVDSQHIRGARVSERDWGRLSNAAGRVGGLPLWIDDNPGATLNSIRAQARRAAQHHELGLVVIDYIQLVNAARRAENRQVEVAEISRGLKRMALEMEVPVVCLAQLNRNVEMRSDKRPTLADLRESGAIENDSDVVIGLYDDAYYNDDSTQRGIVELIILKHRAGPTGTVRLAVDQRYGLYQDLTRGAA